MAYQGIDPSPPRSYMAGKEVYLFVILLFLTIMSVVKISHASHLGGSRIDYLDKEVQEDGEGETNAPEGPQINFWPGLRLDPDDYAGCGGCRGPSPSCPDSDK